MLRLGLINHSTSYSIRLIGFRNFYNFILYRSAYSTQIPAESIDTVGCSLQVMQIAESIEKLSLLETASLIRLNLPDINFSPSSATADVSSSLATNSTADLTSSPEAPKQTEFKVILHKVDPSSKAKVIREIKSILTNLNLVEAKTFVESVPKIVKEKLNQADAEKLKKTLEDLGAIVNME